MNDNKLTLEDYNYNHPKGNIGLLSKKVKDIIIPLNKTCYNFKTDSLNNIILNMFKFKEGYSCIVEQDMTIIGIITDYDIRNYLLKTNSCDTIDILISKKFKYINNIDLSLKEVYKINFLYIPVVIDKKLVGIVKNIK